MAERVLSAHGINLFFTKKYKKDPCENARVFLIIN
jgi:hypothetical protein